MWCLFATPGKSFPTDEAESATLPYLLCSRPRPGAAEGGWRGDLETSGRDNRFFVADHPAARLSVGRLQFIA